MEDRLLAILRLAIRYNASDIHFNLRYNELMIEMRINGQLQKVKSLFNDAKLIRYLQYLSGLDVGKLLEPQTGQFEIQLDDDLLSLRFSVVNTVGSSIGVLRILNSSLDLDINRLSGIEDQNTYFKNILKHQCGLVIFSGPTGSGKTTTLYTILKSVPNKKIYSIEDPIEVFMDNIVQLQINENGGFDYEDGVKQILRHDPDIIMIGEIRDSKAARWAIIAANTGHLVFTTIHASRASSVVSRLSELGVSQNDLYENLLCLSNQRMVLDAYNNKQVIYELMDEKEIEYFRTFSKNSRDFLSVNRQIEKGINEGKLKEVIK